MLDGIHWNKPFLPLIDVTPGRMALLATADHLYALGWGGIVPLGKKVAGAIGSYAFTPEGFLMIVRNDELCGLDSAGNIYRLFKLPEQGMGISAGREVMYVYGRDSRRPSNALYVIARGGKYSRLFDVPAPIRSAVEMNGALIFSNKNGLFRCDPRSRALTTLAVLPKGKEILSVAADTARRKVYFSTDSIVCAVKDSGAPLIINDKFGGVLRFFDGGLMIFNPERRLLIRIPDVENKIASAQATPPGTMQAPAAAPSTATPDTVSRLVAAKAPANAAPPAVPMAATEAAVPASSQEGGVQKKPVDSAKPIIAAKDTAVRPAAFVQAKDTQKEPPEKPPEVKIALTEALPKEAVTTEIVSPPLRSDSAVTVTTISYVNPLKPLLPFYGDRFAALSAFIRKWDQRIRDSLERGRQLREAILQDHRTLTEKMNANARVFSDEILVLKVKLSGDRDGYNLLKNGMVNDGKLLCEELKALGEQTDGAINDKFNEVRRMVAKSRPLLSAGDTVNVTTVAARSRDTTVVHQVAPAAVILACYENEIAPIRDTIAVWNEKALSLIHQDATLAKQLEPLKKELLQYLSTPRDYQKVNRKQIADVKKQCEAINDEREGLADRMADDRKRLSESVDRLKETVRSAVRDRFMGAVEAIGRSYDMSPVFPLTMGTSMAASAGSVSPANQGDTAVTVNAINYVSSVKELLPLFGGRFVSLADFIRKWDLRIRDSLAREKQLVELLAQDEKALAGEMNANTDGFSNKIKALKSKLSGDLEGLSRLKADMMNDGKFLCGQMKGLCDEADGIINDKYNEVCRMAAKYRADPSAVDTVNPLTISKQRIDMAIVRSLAPAAVILACYENEIAPIRDTIAAWNEKALSLMHQDATMAKQLEPLEKELQRYLSAPKSDQTLNKKQIDDLKNSAGSLSRSGSASADRMKDDRGKFSKCIDNLKEEFRGAVKDRFLDAVENIGHAYNDEF